MNKYANSYFMELSSKLAEQDPRFSMGQMMPSAPSSANSPQAPSWGQRAWNAASGVAAAAPLAAASGAAVRPMVQKVWNAAVRPMVQKVWDAGTSGEVMKKFDPAQKSPVTPIQGRGWGPIQGAVNSINQEIQNAVHSDDNIFKAVKPSK